MPICVKPNSYTIGSKCSAKIRDTNLVNKFIARREPRIISKIPLNITTIAGGIGIILLNHTGTIPTKLKLSSN